MELTSEKQATACLKENSKENLKGKSLNEVVNNGWNRLSELYGVDMRKLAAQFQTQLDNV